MTEIVTLHSSSSKSNQIAMKRISPEFPQRMEIVLSYCIFTAKISSYKLDSIGIWQKTLLFAQVNFWKVNFMLINDIQKYHKVW